MEDALLGVGGREEEEGDAVKVVALEGAEEEFVGQFVGSWIDVQWPSGAQ